MFAHHQPLISGDAGSSPPAPPAPPPSTQPPGDSIAFTAVVRESLYGILGTAISSTTMATITCADSSMTIQISDPVPGLTWSYTAGVLSVSGTPTAPARPHRVVVTYIASDGTNRARGSTEHLVTIDDFTTAFTVGSNASASVRIGQTVDVTLCSISTAREVSMFASLDLTVPVDGGNGLVFAWTPAATSTGTLKLVGTIADTAAIGTFTLTARYLTTGQVQTEMGRSVHTIIVQPRYVAASPAPAPAPAPPAPSPSPPPAPSPAPAPAVGPDSLLASVKVLMHFDAATGIATDARGNTFTNHGATLTTGAAGEAASFTGDETYIEGPVPGLDGSDGELCIEAMAQISAPCVADLLAQATLSRFGYCPVVTLVGTDGQPLWMLGFMSFVVAGGGRLTKSYAPVFLPRGASVPNNLPFGQYVNQGYPAATAAPGRFVHLAGLMRVSTINVAQFFQTCWSDFRYRGQVGAGEIVKLTEAPTATLRIGGAVPGAGPDLIRNTTFVPFRGEVDELRGTANRRYASVFEGGSANSPALISIATPILPWPNY